MRPPRPQPPQPQLARALQVAALGVAMATAAPPPSAGGGETRPRPRPAPSIMMAQDPAAEAELFAMPRIAEELRIVFGLVQAGDLTNATRLLDALIERYPEIGRLRADRAALAMLEGDPNLALAFLAAAASKGFEAVAAVMEDPLFASLAEDPRLAALAQAAPSPRPTPRPSPVTQGKAPVTTANTAWNPKTERLEPRFDFPERSSTPVLPGGRTAAQDLLIEHVRRGRAAGNHGDLYDNRDRGHSALAAETHPQLTHVTYAGAARAAEVDYGLNDSILFDRITFGNSSTALTQGPLWRSLPRLALTRPDGTGPMRLWQNAAANHLYVYPAHKDYGDEMGDLFPANTPYILVSRGSSGSDRPFLEAVAMILAAFRPETKVRLAAEALLVPTVQMVFRRSLQHIRSREAYFSGDAHPVAFEGYQINLARMVSLAQSIQPGDIPAEARLRVVKEDDATEGVDFFGQGLSEVFFDTPQAVARVWRSRTGRRSIVLSAEESRDANGRPLSFHWHLLQGDPDRVRIEPLGNGARARITLDWHDPFRISEETPLTSSRVDIGVFVHNGAHDSAPAILSWYFPPHEARIYQPGPDGSPRIAAIDYTARSATYADPMLLPRADWRDDFHYDDQGAATGWTRRRGVVATEYTADGTRILTRDGDGAPAGLERVAYLLRRLPAGDLRLEEVSGELGPAPDF